MQDVKDDETVGFILTGSHARGDSTIYSDVDLIRFVDRLPEKEEDRYTLRVIEGFLVAHSITSIEKKQEGLKKPETAIWEVPGLRQARVLSDRSGRLAELKQQAIDFDWTSLQKAADEYASYHIMGYAEEVHKVLGGLVRECESTVNLGTMEMIWGMAHTIAVKRGIMIKTENLLYEQVCENVGLDSDWTRFYRVASGLENFSRSKPIYRHQGTAALDLYIETVELLREIITPVHRGVVDITVKRIRNSGF